MNAPAALNSDRVAQVRETLVPVCDPELDESVIELGFVTMIDVDAQGGVDIAFRLPTYWCSANFAFLMADDMRRAVAALTWATRVGVHLADHMDDVKINQGLAGGLSFSQTFGAEASGNLEALRRTFEVKAFQRRQEKLLRHLLDAGHTAEALLASSMAQLAALGLDEAGQALRTRYVERRGVGAHGVLAPHAGAFVDEHGAGLKADTLPQYLRSMRLVGVNTEFNGALCRGLLQERYGTGAPGASGAPARTVHFMRQAA